MKKNNAAFITMLVIALSGCSGNNDQQQEYNGRFLVNGISYSTLQEAVNASVNNGCATITLTGDAVGNGAHISENGILLEIDLAGNEFRLNDGEGIVFEKGDNELLVKNGAILGGDMAIVSYGDCLEITGNGSLKCGIKVQSELYLDGGFTGKMNGNLSIDEHIAYIKCPEATISIGNLKMAGDKTAVQIIDAQEGGIRIANVESSAAYPVCGFRDGLAAIGSGKSLHVHSFAKKTSDNANCHELSKVEYTCTECDFSYQDEDFDGGYGKCEIGNLIHVPAHEASDYEFGNVEHWLCPDCGRAYADMDGETAISDFLLLPFSYEWGLNYLTNIDDSNEIDWGQVLNVASGMTSIVGFFTSIGMAIPGLVKDDTQQFIQLNNKLDAIKGQLTKIDNKLDEIYKVAKAAPAILSIKDRDTKLRAIALKSQDVFTIISKILADKSMTDDEKKKKIGEHVEYWGKQIYEGTYFNDLAMNLVQGFVSDGTAPVPDNNTEFANLHFLWEHQGYELRALLLQKDIATCGKAIILAQLYDIDYKSYPSKELKELELKHIKTAWENYTAVAKREIYRIRHRDEVLRKINRGGNGNGVAYKKELQICQVYGWVNARWNQNEGWKICRFPRENQEGAAAKTCNSIIHDDCWDLPLTHSMVDDMVAAYKDAHKQAAPKDIINDYLVSEIGFSTKISYNTYLMVDDGEREFGWDYNVNVAYPNYGPFYWRSKRVCTNDYFGVRWAMSKDGTSLERRFVTQNCGIQSYSTGHVKWWKDMEENYFVSPAVITEFPDTVIKIQPY